VTGAQSENEGGEQGMITLQEHVKMACVEYESIRTARYPLPRKPENTTDKSPILTVIGSPAFSMNPH